MDKSELRKSAIAKLKHLADTEKEQIDKQLTSNLIRSNLWTEAKTIGITVSQGFEWDTKSIIEEAWEQGKTVAVPKCLPKAKKMDFYKLENFHQLEKVYYNLLEPKPEETEKMDKNEMDLLIVPGLVFDKKGYRIGFGGGFYDRFLTDYSNDTIALLHSSQLVESVPRESYDIPVENIVTEAGLVSLL
ncbi:5-formyltetrahydrofolate cyclo-ligase [Oceanobacillus halophilus]|uniref:5-formyltetrahydrofolate cyclo-ligase n=1 Tax=Oceanobacillus halophilus TaxID=930130 RepID=A0A495A3L4_9BACI|nr:5-formyltetrahydrofolate cyclo-ligase [Oceanobacillus halophilus]